MRLATALLFAGTACAQTRIVSTSPAITETLFALGLGSRVAAISDYCHYPVEAMRLPRIGSYLAPNIEAIVRLKPDLVFIERLPNRAVEQLQGSAFRVQPIVTGDLEANLRMMETIAAAAGAAQKGKDLTASIRAELRRIEAQAAKLERRAVLFIVGRTPGRLEGMVAVGKGSYLNELITIAGGRNPLADSPLGYPKVTLEGVIRLKPGVIIDMGEMAETQGVTDAQKQAVTRLWKSRPDLPSRVHAVASDIFVVPGPRMVDAARELVRLIHEDAK